MDALKSAGLQVASASLIGLGSLAYYMWRPQSPKCKKQVAGAKSTKSIVLFFNESGAQCYTRLDHKTDDCELDDCPVRHLRTLRKIISKAKTSVDVCLYNLTQPALEETLITLLREGKRVRCIVGDREESERDFVQRLRSEGAFVVTKDYSPPIKLPFKCSELLMHHKFVIIDSQILITGSMNWTVNSFNYHYDHIIINVDPYLVKQFMDEFQYLYNTPNQDERSCTIRPKGGVPYQVCFFRRNNLICRNDANRKKKCEREDCMFYVYKSILHKIVSATVSIDICVQQITVEDLSNELVFAHENGVKIRLISDHFMSNGTGSQIGFLVAAGIPVHLQSGNGTLHHKFFIVDGKTLLSGSLNWTMQSFFGNYENVVIVTQNDVVARFQTEFERMWDSFPSAQELEENNKK